MPVSDAHAQEYVSAESLVSSLPLLAPVCTSLTYQLAIAVHSTMLTPTEVAVTTQRAVQVTRYLGYSSLKDFFPTMDIKPNPGCANSACRKMQQAYQQQQASPAAQQQRLAALQAAQLQDDAPATHDDNDWGIEVVSELDAVPTALPQEVSKAAAHPQELSMLPSNAYDHTLPEGLQYSLPV